MENDCPCNFKRSQPSSGADLETDFAQRDPSIQLPVDRVADPGEMLKKLGALTHKQQ